MANLYSQLISIKVETSCTQAAMGSWEDVTSGPRGQARAGLLISEHSLLVDASATYLTAAEEQLRLRCPLHNLCDQLFSHDIKYLWGNVMSISMAVFVWPDSWPSEHLQENAALGSAMILLAKWALELQQSSYHRAWALNMLTLIRIPLDRLFRCSGSDVTPPAPASLMITPGLIPIIFHLVCVILRAESTLPGPSPQLWTQFSVVGLAHDLISTMMNCLPSSFETPVMAQLESELLGGFTLEAVKLLLAACADHDPQAWTKSFGPPTELLSMLCLCKSHCCKQLSSLDSSSRNEGSSKGATSGGSGPTQQLCFTTSEELLTLTLQTISTLHPSIRNMVKLVLCDIEWGGAASLTSAPSDSAVGYMRVMTHHVTSCILQWMSSEQDLIWMKGEAPQVEQVYRSAHDQLAKENSSALELSILHMQPPVRLQQRGRRGGAVRQSTPAALEQVYQEKLQAWELLRSSRTAELQKITVMRDQTTRLHQRFFSMQARLTEVTQRGMRGIRGGLPSILSRVIAFLEATANLATPGRFYAAFVQALHYICSIWFVVLC